MTRVNTVKMGDLFIYNQSKSEVSSFITTILIVEVHKLYSNKCLKISNLVLNIVTFLFNHYIPPLIEGMYAHLMETSLLLSEPYVGCFFHLIIGEQEPSSFINPSRWKCKDTRNVGWMRQCCIIMYWSLSCCKALHCYVLKAIHSSSYVSQIKVLCGRGNIIPK